MRSALVSVVQRLDEEGPDGVQGLLVLAQAVLLVAAHRRRQLQGVGLERLRHFSPKVGRWSIGEVLFRLGGVNGHAPGRRRHSGRSAVSENGKENVGNRIMSTLTACLVAKGGTAQSEIDRGACRRRDNLLAERLDVLEMHGRSHVTHEPVLGKEGIAAVENALPLLVVHARRQVGKRDARGEHGAIAKR